MKAERRNGDSIDVQTHYLLLVLPSFTCTIGIGTVSLLLLLLQLQFIYVVFAFINSSTGCIKNPGLH